MSSTTPCPTCGRSCGYVAPTAFIVICDAWKIRSIDMDRWNEEFASIVVTDPWESLRDSLQVMIRKLAEDVIHVVLAPPPNQPWYRDMHEPGAMRQQPGAVYRSRPTRHQARACRGDARRWKRRRFLHALRRRLELEVA